MNRHFSMYPGLIAMAVAGLVSGPTVEPVTLNIDPALTQRSQARSAWRPGKVRCTLKKPGTFKQKARSQAKRQRRKGR